MENVFLKILNMSITSVYIILLVILMRLILKKAPKKYSYMLWIAVAFRAIFPVSFKSVLSIFNLSCFENAAVQSYPSPIADYFSGAGEVSQIPKMPMGNPAEAAQKSVAPLKISAINSANHLQILIFAASVIWVTGIIVMLIYSVVSYMKLRKRLSYSLRIHENIYKSDEVTSPFVMGIFSPKIYLPFGMSESEEEYVILHERYHIKRYDHIIKPFAFLILLLHWFNPLFWVAFCLMSHDMEMSCDEKVIAEKGNIKKNYSTLLVSFAANKRFPMPCPPAFGESGIKVRIKNILTWKKPKMWIRAIAGVLVLSVIVACAANPKPKSDNNIFAKSYRVEKVIYTNPILSFLPQEKEDSPIYELGEDMELRILADTDNGVRNIGKLELSQSLPNLELSLDVGYMHGYSTEKLKKKMIRAWFVSYTTSDRYWIFEDKSGNVYIASENLENDSLSMNWIGELSEYEGEEILNTLFAAKIPYVGYASGVGNIIGLTLPAGFYGSTDGLMELQTNTEPYGLTINYTVEDGRYYSQTKALANQAIMLFALIDNLGEVRYHVESDNGEYTTEFFSRGQADMLFDKNISEYAKDVDGFKELYSLVYYSNNGKYAENASNIYKIN